MSVVLVGEGKSFMASKYLGRGSIVLSDTLNPVKSTLFSANWNLSGLSTIPAWPTRVRTTLGWRQAMSDSDNVDETGKFIDRNSSYKTLCI